MLALTANGLVISGLLILAAALFPVRKLVIQLPAGQVRIKWVFQSILILVFILGYLAYMVLFWSRNARLEDLIVPAVFFFGAGFVWITISLSLQTALDVRRVTLLEQESITDPLIGIYNWRCLDRRIEEEFDKAGRYRQPISLLLIDIDHFKRVNDTYGHQAGDLVLHSWGGLIQGIVRASDVVARFGGDEILVIAPGILPKDAFALAEQICKMIGSHDFNLRGDTGNQEIIHITVSIGVADLNSSVDTVEKFLNDADRALYIAKSKGRNCAASSVEIFKEVLEA
ncbi:MAG: GGDEF domain-containing protein [Anaerolineaceae bacterium]|nr:GGDEF domain-containing protein [Anaerolineaceae bacterium]